MSRRDPPARSGFSIRCSLPHAEHQSREGVQVNALERRTGQITLHREIRLEPLDFSKFPTKE